MYFATPSLENMLLPVWVRRQDFLTTIYGPGQATATVSLSKDQTRRQQLSFTFSCGTYGLYPVDGAGAVGGALDTGTGGPDGLWSP
jgi:hypothetical protein